MKIPILLFLSLLILSGCSRPGKVETNGRGWPTSIRFAFTPDEENPGRREKMYKLRCEYLEKRLGIEVEMVRTTQYGPVIEAMRAKKIEITNLSTFPYLIASKKAGAEAIVAMSDVDGNLRTYHSCIIVKAESDIDSVEELADKAGELSFAFVNPASTSGHLIPRYFLEQHGISPESDFKELVFPGKQNASILSVKSGKVDAAAIASNTLFKLKKYGSVKEGELKVIWKSIPIPSGAISVRSDLPEDLKQAIAQAYVELSTVDPELYEYIRDYYDEYRPDPVGDYMAVDDSIFDEMRIFSGKIKELAMLE